MELFDRVPPFPWAQAKDALRRELGRDPSRVFDYIDPEPVAAGSLAQTHYARLRDGSEVAVKIQRPGIREIVMRDLRRARLLVRVLEASGTSFVLSPRAVLDEVSSWLLQELDFSRELANLSRLYQLTANDPAQKVPIPYAELSTSKVLVTEFVRGVPFTDILRMLRANPRAARGRLRAQGINPRRLAANLLFSCLTQIFRTSFSTPTCTPGTCLRFPAARLDSSILACATSSSRWCASGSSATSTPSTAATRT